MSDLLAIAEEAVVEYGAIQKTTELATLLGLAQATRPSVVWEIGTAAGGTLWALARALAQTEALGYRIPEFVSIDLPGGPFSGGLEIAKGDLEALIRDAAHANPKVTVICGDSKTVELPDVRPDIVVIDGDHTLAGVTADFERFFPLVNPGGFVALHDILPHPLATGVYVEELWRDLVANPELRTVEIGDCGTRGIAGNTWGGIGIVFR